MRTIFLAFLAVFFVSMFSCATKPKPEEEQTEEQSVALDDEALDSEALSNIEGSEETDEQLAEEELPSDFQEEITKADINELPAELAELLSEDTKLQVLPPVTPPTPAPAQVPQPVQEQPPVQVQAPPPQEPVAQEQRPRLPQPPQTPPPSPPLQTPVVPPPAALGPAEEIPKERETITATRIEPQRESPAVAAAIPPSVVVPQNGGEIVFSRIVRATVGQIVEIPFRGTGWVYLGEIASRRGIEYNSRRLDPQGQSFVFKAEEAGTYALKFFRQDFIRDYILNDHVQVIVGEAPGSSAGWFNPPHDLGRVVAEPRWPSALDEAEIQRGTLVSPGSIPSAPAVSSAPAPSSATAPSTTPTPSSVPAPSTAPSTVPATDSVPSPNAVSSTSAVPTPSSVSVPSTVPADTAELPASQPETTQRLSADVILQRAKEAFDGGNVTAAITLLDQYTEYFPSGTDELYWYYGQFYEANTPSRNILLSLDYYRRLTDEYPQSSRFNDARRRIAYLERFYINIQ